MGVAKAQLNERAEVRTLRFQAGTGSADACHTGTAVRYFNTEGPVVAERHYCIPPLSRVNLDELLELITDMKYFVLHAPRQTGKTSTLLALQDRLNEEGEYRCLYVNFEAGQAAGEDTARAMQALLGGLASRALDILQDDFVDRTMSEYLQKHGPDGGFSETLVRWSAANPKPLVLLIDEIDSLVGDTLISVLRQLRANYDRRPHHFPQSVILCGVRDVRDYQIFSSREGTNIRGAAPSTSRRSRCASATSRNPRCGSCWPSTLPSTAKPSRTVRPNASGRSPAASRGW